MDENVRSIETTFRLAANEVFQTTWRNFRRSVSDLARDGNENVHQLTRAKFTASLRGKLNHIAVSIIDTCTEQTIKHELRTSLAAIIHYFEIEFIRKSDEI